MKVTGRRHSSKSLYPPQSDADLDRKQKKRRVAGGSATGGGINFQAAVTAIAAVYMSRGQPLHWLDGVTSDVVLSVEAETGGAGDDVRLVLACGERVEAQVKKGLSANAELWETLAKLAAAVTSGDADYGLLLVSPTSSRTIRETLARDIALIGDSQIGNLSEIGAKWLKHLRDAGTAPEQACARIRIQTVAALAFDQAAVQAARAELAHLCANNRDVETAWLALYADAGRLIEQRGRRDVASIVRVLRAVNVTLTAARSSTPAPLLAKLADWTSRTNATFPIFGVEHPLDIDSAWIPLNAVARESTVEEDEEFAKAVERYQAWEKRTHSRDATSVAPETLGRFITRVVLIAGPGMGKTTLLKRIARAYSSDLVPVLKVRLAAVASRMQTGQSFEEAVFALGLDGSGIAPADARAAHLSHWLLLCDGLDECGLRQEDIAEGIARFSAGYPDCRIIVTTRPVGYRVNSFASWRNYDISALDYSAAHAHAAQLIEAIAPSDSEIHKKAWEISYRELKEGVAAEIVGRTPLLLALAAAMLARGQALAATREQLFEQLFNLVDEVPNSRVHDRPYAPAVLRRFVDILAWNLTEHPLSQVDTTLQCCGKVLEQEMGLASMAARGAADEMLVYWERIGLVEQVGRGDQQTIAFIHKSFGEFAAARKLHTLERKEQVEAIKRVADDSAWAEVIRFAALTGLGDMAAEALFGEQAASVPPDQVPTAVELITDGRPSPSVEIRTKIFVRAIDVVRSDRRFHAWKVGTSLVSAGRKFSLEVGPLVQGLLQHDQYWTRLIGWATAVAAGPAYYQLDDLVAMLRAIPAELEVGIRTSLSGHMILSARNEHDLAEQFILDACSDVIDRASPEIADEVVPAVLNYPNLGSVGFIQRARSLIANKKKSYVIKSLDSIGRDFLAVPEGYAQAQAKAYAAIFDALDLPAPSGEVASSCKPPLLHLSAFLEATKFGHVEASDAWRWTWPYDSVATRTVLRATIVASGIDREALRAEAMYARHYLETATDNDAELAWLFRITTYVDPPQVDWRRPQLSEQDVALVEAALAHPSRWLIWLAANLLDAVLDSEARISAVRRLFVTGRGNTLWAACGIISEIDAGRRRDLLLDRLQQPLVPGCEYLFVLLHKSPPPLDQRVMKALHAALMGTNVDVAMEAAKLAILVARPDAIDLRALIDEAYGHWLKTEKPYPAKGGVVPKSPRQALAEARRQIEPPSYDSIRVALNDTRPDVREFGLTLLAERLASPAGERMEFLKDISIGALSPHVLGSCLQKAISFSIEELTYIEGLLEHGNKSIRYGAMALLDDRYLSAERIHEHVTRLATDEEQQIRDRAHTIIDRQNPNGRS